MLAESFAHSSAETRRHYGSVITGTKHRISVHITGPPSFLNILILILLEKLFFVQNYPKKAFSRFEEHKELRDIDSRTTLEQGEAHRGKSQMALRKTIYEITNVK